jgi:hypothetical protein
MPSGMFRIAPYIAASIRAAGQTTPTPPAKPAPKPA